MAEKKKLRVVFKSDEGHDQMTPEEETKNPELDENVQKELKVISGTDEQTIGPNSFQKTSDRIIDSPSRTIIEPKASPDSSSKADPDMVLSLAGRQAVLEDKFTELQKQISDNKAEQDRVKGIYSNINSLIHLHRFCVIFVPICELVLFLLFVFYLSYGEVAGWLRLILAPAAFIGLGILSIFNAKIIPRKLDEIDERIDKLEEKNK